MDNLTLVIAVWGAITGTAAVIVTVAAYFRDRGHLKVRVSIGRLTESSGWSEPLLFVETVNAGRRQIEVTGAGLTLESGPDRLFLTGNPTYYKTPAILAEGETHKTWTALTNVAREVNRLGHGLPVRAYYRDSLGREYSTPIPSNIKDDIRAEIGRLLIDLEPDPSERRRENCS
jgi:hypothetical protein